MNIMVASYETVLSSRLSGVTFLPYAFDYK